MRLLKKSRARAVGGSTAASDAEKVRPLSRSSSCSLCSGLLKPWKAFSFLLLLLCGGGGVDIKFLVDFSGLPEIHSGGTVEVPRFSVLLGLGTSESSSVGDTRGRTNAQPKP